MGDFFATPLFCKVGTRPVKSEREPISGDLIISAYDRETGKFIPALAYLDKLYLGNNSDVTFLEKHEFDEYVMSLEMERTNKTNKKDAE